MYHDDPWDDEGHPLAGGTETHRSVELDHRNDAGTLWHYRAALIQSSAPSALLKIGEAVSTPGV